MHMEVPPDEIILIDQTKRHDQSTQRQLSEWSTAGRINWVRLDKPSIPVAMNVGLRVATGPVVLFLDDDIVPGEHLISAHADAHQLYDAVVVGGRVVQPWDIPGRKRTSGTEDFDFNSTEPGFVTQFMGGNFSIKRNLAFGIGGIDENFVKVAYRFEREMADRLIDGGHRIYYEPRASIRHLKAEHGGTRRYAARWFNPGHGVGEYYYLLRSRIKKDKTRTFLLRPFRAVTTSYHRARPWMIPVTLSVELVAMFWALALSMRGPRFLMDDITKQSGKRMSSTA